MARSRHPTKEIEAVIALAEESGWRIEKGFGHCWGRLLCPHHDRDGCQVSVYSTPRNPLHHARHLARIIAKCAHCLEEREDDSL